MKSISWFRVVPMTAEWSENIIQVGVTKKMNDKYGLNYSSDAINGESSLFTWHANIFKFNRKTGIIFVNDLTRYSVLAFDIKKSDMKNLLDIFKWQLKRMINSHYYKLDVIENYMDLLNDFEFVKTSSRKILGHININTEYLMHGLYEYEFIGKFELDQENIRLNEIPMQQLKDAGYKYHPSDAMEVELEKLFQKSL